jgi:hypothetical protein
MTPASPPASTSKRSAVRFLPLLVLIALALAAGGALQFMGFVDSAGVVVDALNDAQRVLMVRRPEPWQHEIRRSTRAPRILDRSQPCILYVIGFDPTGKHLYLAVDLGEADEDASKRGDSLEAAEETSDGDAEDGDTGDSDVDLQASLCRIDINTGRVDWLSRDETIRGIFLRRDPDRAVTLFTWITENPPRFGSVPSRRPDRLPARTLWRFDPDSNSRESLLEGRKFSTTLNLAENARWLAYEKRRDHARGTHILQRSAQGPSYHPPAGARPFLDAHIHHIYGEGPLALATVKFPNFGRRSFTEFLEIDLASGQIHSALDQAGQRLLDATTFRMIAESHFSIRGRGKTRQGSPFTIIGFYGVRPLRHLADVPGFAAYPSDDATSAMVLDTSHNRFVPDHSADIPEGLPIIRRLDFQTAEVSSVRLHELGLTLDSDMTAVDLMKFWRFSQRTSPVSPAGALLPVPTGVEDDPRMHLVDLDARTFKTLQLSHPVTNFRWSPSGNRLALSSASFGRSESGSDPEPPHGLSIWDRAADSVVHIESVELIPLDWIDENTLVMIAPRFSEPATSTRQPRLFYSFTFGEGVKPYPGSLR